MPDAVEALPVQDAEEPVTLPAMAFVKVATPVDVLKLATSVTPSALVMRKEAAASASGVSLDAMILFVFMVFLYCASFQSSTTLPAPMPSVWSWLKTYEVMFVAVSV